MDSSAEKSEQFNQELGVTQAENKSVEPVARRWKRGVTPSAGGKTRQEMVKLRIDNMRKMVGDDAVLLVKIDKTYDVVQVLIEKKGVTSLANRTLNKLAEECKTFAQDHKILAQIKR